MKRKTKKVLSLLLTFCMAIGLFAGMTPLVSASAPEVTISNSYGSGSYTLTSSGAQTAYNITVTMDPAGLTEPVLKITVPKGFTLNSYPTASDVTLSSSFAESDPFSKSTDENSNTLLTYKWKANITPISFSINVTPTIQGCYSQAYSVTATLLDGTEQVSTAANTITIINPTTSADSFNLNYYSSSSVTLGESTDYYVPVAFAATPYRFYLFDKFEITLPLVSGTTPCYKAAGTSVYTAFEDGVRTWVETGTGTSNLNYQGYVTYNSSYSLNGNSVPVLVIELFPQGSTVDEHTINNQSSLYTYYPTGGYGCSLNAVSSLYNRADIGIYEKYASPAAGATYQPSKSAQFVGYHNNTPVTLCASGNANANYKVTFKNFVWAEHFKLDSSYTSFRDVKNSWNSTIQSEKNRYYFSTYFFSDIGSTTPATNVQLKFTAAAKLHCDKILINADYGLTVAPTSMTVSYKTIKGGDTVYTDTVSTATTDSSLWYYQALCFAPLLDDDDGIVEATLTLDRLGPSASTSGTEFVRAFVKNAENIFDGTTVSASLQILGGNCDTSYFANGTFGSQTAITATATLAPYSYSMSNIYATNTAKSSTISTLSKGDSFAVVLNNSNYPSWYPYDNFYTEVVNPEYYLLMPSDYIFNGFTPSSGWSNASYTLTSKAVTVDITAASTYGITAGNYVLYAVKYAEGTYTGGSGLSKSQLFKFTVGPTKDTSVVASEKLPVLAGFRNDSIHFVDSSTKYADLLDVDSDSNTTETMVFKKGGAVTINAAAAFSTYSALTSDTVSGVQNDTMSYANDGSGTAVVTVSNGSSSTVSDLMVIFSVGKKGAVLGSNTANWDANVRAAPSFTGGLTGASVSYSTDNGSTYGAAPANLSTVTNIKVTLSAIAQSGSGTISVPFTAAFDENTAALDNCYIKTSITYNTDGSSEKILTLQPSAASVQDVSADGYSSAYDGTAHGITVTAPTGATVKYGTTAGSYTLNDSPTYTNVGEYTVYYRVSQTGYFAVTGSQTVNISKANQSAPANVGKTNETSQNEADGTITGVTDKMEYSADNGTSWTVITGTTVTGLAAGTYLVRYAADSNHNGGDTTEIVIAAGGSSVLTVTFDTQGGSVSPATSGVNAGGTLDTLPTPTKTDYSFDGWYTAASGGNAVTTASVFTSDATIYAHWTYSGSTDVTSSTGAPVIVDGKSENIGTQSTSGASTTVAINQSQLTDKIDHAAEGSAVVVSVSENTNAIAQLVVKNIEDMATKDMTLTVQTGNVAYNLSTSAIDTKTLAAAFGVADTSLIPFTVTISNSSATVEGETVVLSPVEFTVTATYGGKTVSVDTFSAYVNRTVEVTKEQAAKITTAVVVNADGSTRHVPTNVIEKDGKFYAIINSRTNSTYALIENVVTFSDAVGKWYEAVVNEMGSREIIKGYGNGIFDGEAYITRADFVTILVRALGLPANGTSTFTDVSASAFYFGSVATAAQYGLVNGRDNNNFDPSANITRQEAMAMLQRAAKLTNFTGTSASLSDFSDAENVSTWAQDAVKWNVGSGLIKGSNGQLRPNDCISRAESATIILRLLQKAKLVDTRAAA